MSQCPSNVQGCSGYSPSRGCAQDDPYCTPGGNKEDFPMPGLKRRLGDWSNYLQMIVSASESQEQLSTDINQLKNSIDSLRLNLE